jgi:hypothetical protein
MGAVVLPDATINPSSDLGRQLVVDLARYRENLLDEKTIRKRYRFDESTWQKLADDDELIRAVEAEAVRRIADGSVKRERSQVLVARAPTVLGDILNDASQSARHRIDSCKVLNDLASNGPGDTAPASDRFVIQINLGADTLTFNKSIRPLEPGEIDPDDSSPSDTDSMPHLAAMAAKKSTDGGNGNAL